MMLQWFVLLTLFVHNSLAFGLYDDTDDYDLWRRQLGGPGVQPTSKIGCRKDILIIVDSSNSIGTTFFENIRKFLLKLVEKLNVGEDGTHLGFITFSSASKTKKLLDVGEKTNPKKLQEWLNSLNYKTQLMGGYTRTGLAFEIANNMFSQTSPLNNRDTVEDVILLLTDGEPHASGHDGGDEGERAMVVKETNKLKAKNVKIIGVAAGTTKQNKKFKTYIQSWVTRGTTVAEMTLRKRKRDKVVDEIVNMLISPLCKTVPGNCSCNKGIEPFKVYVKKGEIPTQVEWPVPITCTGGASYAVDPPNANAKSGDTFGLGKQVITYSSSYINDAGKNVDLKCPVQFTVVACGCSSNYAVIKDSPLGGTDPRYPVSWSKPKPNCTPKTDKILLLPPDENSANIIELLQEEGKFYAGEYTFTYKYRVGRKFDLECDVKFAVP